MIKLFLVKFNSNLAFGIGGWKRENYKKGDKVVVLKDDMLKLLRLGCDVMDETEVTAKTKNLFTGKKSEVKEVEETPVVEVEKVEVVETETKETVEAPAETEKVEVESTEKVEETETEKTGA